MEDGDAGNDRSEVGETEETTHVCTSYERSYGVTESKRKGRIVLREGGP